MTSDRSHSNAMGTKTSADTQNTPDVPSNSTSETMDMANKLDRLAIWLSGVCVLHCLLAPILITLVPIFSSNVLEDILFHQLMLYLVLPTSTIALLIGCRKHRDWLILGTGTLGMLLLVSTALFGHDYLSVVHEKIATSVAGIILAASHILNYRACQQLTCDDDNCGSTHHH